jgi:ABC-type glycerol-3-phosphate transport system substrate-binding protein
MDEHIDRQDGATADAIGGLVSGEISRETFVKRMALLGFSASAIGGMLAAAGKADASAGRAFAGKTVSILVAAEGDDKGVQDKIPFIKKQFGIDVKMTALPVGPLNEKLSQNVKAPTSSFDAIMVLGFTVSAFVGGGFFDPLNKYLKNVPPGYDFPHDFPAGELQYVGYYDVKHQRAGGNTLYLIPGLHGGSVVLFYRKDLFAKAGLKPPTTWTAYLNAARTLNTGGVAGNSIIAKSGDVSMFLCDWYTRFINMGGILMSGSPTTKNYAPRLTSPTAVAALQHMVDCVKYASPGVQSYDFTVSTNAFSAGKTAMMLVWSTIAGPVYNPKSSKVASKVGVAVPPVKGQAVRGGWGMGIPKNAPAANKDAAWTVITYLTSKAWEQYQTLKYQTDPTRNSTYFSPALNKKLPYLATAGKVFQKARTLEIANIPETFELITDAAIEFSAALSGSSTAAAACQKANDKWISVLKRGGHLK